MKKNYKDIFSTIYLRKIKKTMQCPDCKEGNLNLKKDKWICESCGFTISDNEFKNKYIFWFCDNCGAFLNSQNGFVYSNEKNICNHCGYENNTTLNNIKGICYDCGKILDDKEATLCEECKIIRKEKTKKNIIKVAEGFALLATVAISTYSVVKLHSDGTLEKIAKDAAKKIKPNKIKDVGEKAIDVAKEPVEKVIYKTKTWNGYGKQNYYRNVYKRIGDEIVKFKEHTYKFFDGHENNWVEEFNPIDRWNINDPNMPEWLQKYI